MEVVGVHRGQVVDEEGAVVHQAELHEADVRPVRGHQVYHSDAGAVREADPVEGVVLHERGEGEAELCGEHADHLDVGARGGIGERVGEVGRGTVGGNPASEIKS